MQNNKSCGLWVAGYGFVGKLGINSCAHCHLEKVLRVDRRMKKLQTGRIEFPNVQVSDRACQSLGGGHGRTEAE
jgi:hypothetical protein